MNARRGTAARRKENNVWGAIQNSLSLLSRRDQFYFFTVALIQMATGFLDLFGVLLIGLITAVALGDSIGGSSLGPFSQLLQKLPFEMDSNSNSIVILAGFAGLILVTKSGLNIFLTRYTLRFLAEKQAQVSANLTARLMAQPISYLHKRASQENVYALTTGVNFATLMVLGQASILLSESTLLVLLTLALALVSPLETIFAVVFFSGVAWLLHQLLATRAGRLGKTSSAIEIDSFAAIQEAISSYREIYVSNRRAFYVTNIRKLRREASTNQADMSMVGLLPKYVLEIALVVGSAFLVASQLLVRDTAAALAIIALFLVAGSRILPSVLRLQGAALVIRSAAGQAAPTYLLADELKDDGHLRALEMQEDEIVRSVKGSSDEMIPSVALDDVTFCYPGSNVPALSDVGFQVPAGSSLAITGSTGSGKSTLADLILGLILPQEGSVEIGGVPPSVAARLWPGGMGYVPQQAFISNSSIRRNIALGVPPQDVSDDLVWEALEKAHLFEFIRSLDRGLDTFVGEHGVRLSGGQKQRLGLARALYSSPKLLVLDEATSALDTETEQSIATTMARLRGEVTTIVIAHRLATVRGSDQVIYLESGRLAAKGTFDQVRQQSESFNRQAILSGIK